MIIENINAQNQLIHHLKASIQEYKQNTTHTDIFFDIHKLCAILINNSVIDLQIIHASLDDPNIHIWTNNHDKIRELFAENIDIISLRYNKSFLEITNIFLISSNVQAMYAWHTYLFKYLICKSIIKFNAISKINLEQVALFYTMCERHFIVLDGQEPEFIQCMRLVIECQIENIKHTMNWTQKYFPGYSYYSQTVLTQLEKQASQYINIIQEEQKNNLNNEDNNAQTIEQQEYLQEETKQADKNSCVIEKVNTEIISDDSFIRIDMLDQEQDKNKEEPSNRAIEIKDNKPTVQNILIDVIKKHKKDQKRNFYASLDDIDDEHSVFEDESFLKTNKTENMLSEKGNFKLIETKIQNYVNNSNKKTMLFEHNSKNKKKKLKQQNQPDIYEIIKTIEKLQDISDKCSNVTDIARLKEIIDVSLIQNIIENILNYDAFNFYMICMSIVPPLQESILPKMCSDNICMEFNNTFQSLNSEVYYAKLNKKIKSILYKRYSEYETNSDIYNERNLELLPYINFVNAVNEHIIITYLKLAGSIDENILIYILKNMSKALIYKLNDRNLISLCGFLFQHSVALEHHSINKNISEEFTKCVLELSTHEHIARILHTNYLYTFDWVVIRNGFATKEEHVFFNEKVWINFVKALALENNINDNINKYLVDIFLYYPDSYEKLSKKFIEKISEMTQKPLIRPDIYQLKEIIELRCVEYLNMYNNVIVSFIEVASQEQLSLIFTEKTLKAKNFALQNQSLLNILLHSSVIMDVKIQNLLKEKKFLFTPEIINNENLFAYIDTNGEYVSSPDIMPIVAAYEQIDTLTGKNSSNKVKMLFEQNQKVINQSIQIFIKNLAGLPSEIINNIKPEILTKNIIFNKQEQLSLFILLCIFDNIDILNGHKEFIEYLKTNFNNLTCMNGSISYLQMLMFSKKGVKFYEEHGIANVIKPNAFNIEHPIAKFQIGPANIEFPHLLCTTPGMMFILSNAFTEKELLEKDDILARIDKGVLDAKLPLTNELRKTTNRGRNVLRVVDVLKTENKNEIIKKLKNVEKQSKSNNKLAFF